MSFKVNYGADANAASEVIAVANIADNAIVRGDGGAKGIQDSIITIDDSGNMNMQATSGIISLTIKTGDTDQARLDLENSAGEWRFFTSTGGDLLLFNGTGAVDSNVIRVSNDAANVAIDMQAGETVINQDQADVDFRVESASGANGLFYDAGNARLGINEGSPDETLHLTDASAVTVKLEGGSNNLTIACDSEYDTTFTKDSGSAIHDTRLLPADTTSAAAFRLFIQSGSTGTNDLVIFQPNGTTQQHRLSGGRDSFLCGDSDDLLIGGTSGADGKVHIINPATGSVKQVLHLEQLDVSEEMFGFETTIGVGNAIEAVGAKTLTTTHFIKCNLSGVGTRYIPLGTIA